MNPLERQYLPIFYAAAAAAGHRWPGAAAAEAWNETGGQPPRTFPEMPMLASGAPSYNCLGIKVFKGWTGSSVNANGTEELPDSEWTGPQLDNWCVFPSFEACFAQQVIILQEPRYAAARAATTPEAYIAAECPVWSTNQQKAADVLATYHAHLDLLTETESASF